MNVRQQGKLYKPKRDWKNFKSIARKNIPLEYFGRLKEVYIAGWRTGRLRTQKEYEILADGLDYKTTIQSVCMHCGNNIGVCSCFIAGIRQGLRGGKK